MRKVALAAGVIAALVVGAGPALAFQEIPRRRAGFRLRT